MYNKQRRTYERQEDQTGVPFWRREAGRSKSQCSEISAGPNPGDSGRSPRVSDYGPEVHRDRIPRHSKSSRKRSSSRLCLELTQLAPSWGLASFPMQPVSSRKQQATSNLSHKPQASSSKLQAFKIIVDKI